MGTQKEWTVLFLAQVKDTSDDVSYFSLFLKDLKKFYLTDQTEIVFCVNFKVKYWSTFFEGDTTLPFNYTDQEYSTCLFRLKKNIERQSELQYLRNISDFDITSPEDIGRKFILNMQNQYPARKNLLFTWDHGNGYTIFRGLENAQSSSLTMRRLNRAISIGNGNNGRMDLVIMLNCWMQLIDTPYALQSEVEYLIAPQDEVLLDVYDYVSIFQILQQNPFISAHNLSRDVIDTIRKKESNNVKTVSIGAVHCSKMEEFFLKLDLLAETLSEQLNINSERNISNTKLLKKIRNSFLSSYVLRSGKRFIDLHSMLNNLKIVFETPEATTLCEELIAIIENAIVDFFSNHPVNDRLPFKAPHGISIVSPFAIPRDKIDSQPIYFEQPDDTKETAFKKTKWGVLTEIMDFND